MERDINILAISGSLRKQSTNTLLMQAMIELAPSVLNFQVYDQLNDLAHFNPDLDVDDGPVAVQHLRSQLKQADGVLVCTPEYGNGIPGVLKNALDWIVSSGEWMNKPTVVVAASPSPLGGDKAHASILLTLNMINAHILYDASFTIPHITMKMNKQGEVIDPDTKKALRNSLLHLAEVLTIEKK
ncbi:NADPH-dependent FMN reductase [Paenibacillus xylanilyticus]|uniref:NAD(P)H-dependent oxidoreductase n=1 Tax=Paenibacillus xylanilyticus TaxID=248903 RepID=A0A7Y6BSM1_9BACL|nr:NAD(P)H-dependent oxidoreductase [Paenibacillus xylanilyticus]NUU74046.1 NAD(P)H-dependent oxidoreductase [Paenibacillus xylanilyticus]